MSMVPHRMTIPLLKTTSVALMASPEDILRSRTAKCAGIHVLEQDTFVLLAKTIARSNVKMLVEILESFDRERNPLPGRVAQQQQLVEMFYTYLFQI